MLRKLKLVAYVVGFAVLYMIACPVLLLVMVFLWSLVDYAYGAEVAILSSPFVLALLLGYAAGRSMRTGALMSLAVGIVVVMLTHLGSASGLFAAVFGGVDIPPISVLVLLAVGIIAAFAVGGYMAGRRLRRSQQVDPDTETNQADAAEPDHAVERNQS